MVTIRTAAVTAAILVAALAAPKADILEQVLVKVNGDIITKTDLEQRQIAALRQKDPNLRPENQAALQQALAEITPEVIVDAVDELLILQRGREQDVAAQVAGEDDAARADEADLRHLTVPLLLSRGPTDLTRPP